MIAGLRGVVAGADVEGVLIDVQGVIYRVGTSSTTIADLAQHVGETQLFTRLIVREDQLALYGFLSPEELALFDLVTSVGGIGPRLGCAILSRFTPERLHAALTSGDVALLATVPGIGQKTAARMIVDLRGKLPQLGTLTGGIAIAPVDAEAIEALKALGYSVAEANAAIASLPRDTAMTVEERIVAALQLIAE